MAQDGEVAHPFQPLMGRSRSFFWGLMEAKWPTPWSRPTFPSITQGYRSLCRFRKP